MPNYDVVKSADKKWLTDFGIDVGVAHHLARGRKFWLPYGDRKPIIETDWEELYDIFIKSAFPMGFEVDKSIKKSHKKGFMNVLSIMQLQLIMYAEMELMRYQEPDVWVTGSLPEIIWTWKNRLNQINNWNRDGISYDFLNWQDNPWEVKG